MFGYEGRQQLSKKSSKQKLPPAGPKKHRSTVSLGAHLGTLTIGFSMLLTIILSLE